MITSIIIIIIIHWIFFIPVLAGGFSLECEWQQVSRTLLSIMADLRNAVVRMVSTCPLNSKSSSIFIKSLRIVLSAPITIGFTVIFMLHSYSGSLASSKYLNLFSISLIFIQWSTGTSKYAIRQLLFFFTYQLIWCSGRDLSENPREFWAIYSPAQIQGFSYTTYSYGQISFSCTITSGSPFPSSCVLSHMLFFFAIICFIRF